MTATAEEIRQVLERVTALPESERADVVRATPNVEATLLALGDEAERLVVVEVARALATAELVISLADDVGGVESQSRARRAMAQALAYAGRHAEALSMCADAIDIAEAGQATIFAARARIASIHPLAELGRIDDAIHAGTLARSALAVAGEAALAARADINLGVVLRKRGDAAGALRHFDRAVEALHDEPVILAQLESNRGEALLELDRLNEAEQAFERALTAFEQMGNLWGASVVEGNLADLATKQGRYDRALHFFESARTHIERDQSPTHFARLLLEQGDARRTVGILEEAARDYTTAIEILREEDQVGELARAHAGLGQVAIAHGDVEAAMGHLREARARWKSIGHADACARIDLLLCDLAISSGDLGTADELAADAQAVFAPESLNAAAAETRLARIALQRAAFDDASAHVQAALEIVRRRGLTPIEADVLIVAAQIERGAGRTQSAIDVLNRSVTLLERVRGTLQADRMRDAFLGNRSSAFTLLASCLLDRGDRESIAGAFDATERGRGRSLLDAMTGLVGLGTGCDTGDEQSQELLQTIEATRSRLNVLYARADTAGGRMDSDARQEIEQLEATLSDLESRIATYGMTDLFAEPTALASIQTALPPKSALIEYFEEDGQVSAFVVTAASTACHRRFARMSDVADVVRRVHFQLGRALRPGALTDGRDERLLRDSRAVLARAYDMVVRPLEPDLHGVDRLVIAADGPLHALPFAALWTGEAWLVERAAIVYTPTASVFAQAVGRDGTQAHGEAVVIGVADDKAPDIQREVNAVRAVLPTSRVLLDDATADEVGRALDGAAIAHIASHGRFDPRNPLASGIRLRDRWLTVRDVYRLRLPDALVVLSGCETGVSNLNQGNELIGMVRAFLAAGAATLVVSQWRVKDDVATDLMCAFYQQIARTERGRAALFVLADALRDAQINTLLQHPHPALWAPFTLVGRP